MAYLEKITTEQEEVPAGELLHPASIEKYKKDIYSLIEQHFGKKIIIDKRISESAKQI